MDAPTPLFVELTPTPVVSLTHRWFGFVVLWKANVSEPACQVLEVDFRSAYQRLPLRMTTRKSNRPDRRAAVRVSRRSARPSLMFALNATVPSEVATSSAHSQPVPFMEKWEPASDVRGTDTTSPAARAEMSSICPSSVMCTLHGLKPIVSPDFTSLFPVAFHTWENPTSPTWVTSYVAAARADGASPNRRPTASSPWSRRVACLSMSHHPPCMAQPSLRRRMRTNGMARIRSPPQDCCQIMGHGSSTPRQGGFG